jgi:predicted dithiol-disulfide oxidoreductase (DUF899 family)
VAEPDLAPELPSSELQPGQGIDRDGVRVDERAHVADDHLGAATLQHHAEALAEPWNIAASDGAADAQDDRGRTHFRERPVRRAKLIALCRSGASSFVGSTDEFSIAAWSNYRESRREEGTMSLPRTVLPDEWLVARKELLAEEKAMTRARDALNRKRRELPMVKIEKDYVFEGPDGKASLLDLFDGRRQLIVGHFMFDPSWDDGCPSCSAGADEISKGHLEHLHARDTSFVYVSRAPLAKIEAYKARRGWTFPWYSSYGSDFNYDFHVTMDEAVAPVEYNYRTKAEHEQAGTSIYVEGDRSIEDPGRSCFLRDGDTVFHTYSVYARGLETIGGSYYMLDETALGRQEDWEEPKGRATGTHAADPSFPS